MAHHGSQALDAGRVCRGNAEALGFTSSGCEGEDAGARSPLFFGPVRSMADRLPKSRSAFCAQPLLCPWHPRCRSRRISPSGKGEERISTDWGNKVMRGMGRGGDNNRPRVAFTLASYGLTIAVVLGLVTGAIQIVLDYRQQTFRDEVFIQNILNIAFSGASEAAFQLDPRLASESIDSLMTYDFLSGARITDDQGNILAEIERDVPPSPFDRLTRIYLEPLRNYSMDLTDQTGRLKVGRLDIQVNENALLRDFYSRSVRYMLAGLLRNFLLTGILLYLFHVVLTRPLEWLVAQLDRVDPRLPEPFDPGGQIRAADNEVTMVAASANSILAASRQHLQELQEANREAAKLDEKLRQSERLSVVGQMVGGISHDFNNILAVILGNLELIAPERLTDAECRALENMRMAVESGANLTGQLLIFSRRQPLAPSVILADDFLKELDQFSRPLLGEHHDVKYVLGHDVWPCIADKRQLEAALLNLAINASHAKPKDGTILIESFNVQLDEDYCATEVSVEPGDYVCFSVTDTGAGMSEDVVLHAFEPYFTTKSAGQGSGLGLAMVYGFAKQSGGHVKIYSQQNVGTTVKLYLPRLINDDEVPLSSINRRLVPIDAPDFAGKQILVVEDDPAVLEVMKRHLGAMRATVIAFATGQGAIDYAQRNKPVDAAILDVILRGDMNGSEIRDALLRIWPGLRTAFMSGYTANALEHTSRLGADLIILQKPFSKQRLAEVLDQLFEVSDGKGRTGQVD